MNRTIKLNELSLREKLAQMIIVRGDIRREQFSEIRVGGIFLGEENSLKEYKKIIEFYKKKFKIKPFFRTDLEGAWNPFKHFKEFPRFMEIKTKKEAFNLGKEQGKLLSILGFNLNFSPVAELNDQVYKTRTFEGNTKEIQEKLGEYIRGLQKFVLGTCKHYPGRSLLINQHIFPDKENITREDLALFDSCLKENISAVMIGHTISSGYANSNGLPASISPLLISQLRKKFKGLIISDDTNMLGLRFYSLSKKSTYKRLINAGNDIIIDVGFLFGRYSGISPRKLKKILNYLEKETIEGRIKESKINESVNRILTAKGYKVINK